MKKLLHISFVAALLLSFASSAQAQHVKQGTDQSVDISDYTLDYHSISLDMLKEGVDENFYSGSTFGLKNTIYGAYPALQNIRYNRVDGLFLGVQKDRMNYTRGDFLGIENIELHGSLGYSFGQQDIQYMVGVETALDADRRLIIGGEYHKATTTEDYWRAGRTENSISAFAVGYDVYDYYQSEGLGFYGLLNLNQFLEIGISYNNEQYSSLDQHTDYSVFQTYTFRDNPGIDRNFSSIEQQSFTFGISINPEQSIQHSILSSSLSLKAEIANLLGSGNDFFYNKYLAESKSYLKLNSSTLLQWRVMGGSITGTAPDFKQFALGGIGTMRAIGYKMLTGNQMILSNLQLEFGESQNSNNGWPDLNDASLLLFLDSGWSQLNDDLYSEDNPIRAFTEFSLSGLSHNAGIGLGLGMLRFEVAYPVAGAEGMTTYWIRLNPAF